MFFASPDFGAGGAVLLAGFVVLLCVLGVTILGVVRGIKLLRRPASSKLSGGVLVVTSLILPVMCCSTPDLLFRLRHDTPPRRHYPTNIKEGMSMDQVRGLLGKPHGVHDQNNPVRVMWYYYRDSLGLDWFTVWFGADGKVETTGGN